MLDQALVSRIDQIVQAQQSAYSAAMNQRCTAVIHELSAKGAFGSGAMVVLLDQACRSTLEEQAQFVWNTFKRVLTTLQVQWYDGIESDLKEQMRLHLNGIAGEANRIYHVRLSDGGLAGGIAGSTTINEGGLLGIYSAEIDLYTDGLRVSTRNGAAAQGNTYSVGQGNLVVIQAPYATANVTYNAENLAGLKAILEEFAQAINSSNMPETPKQEALSVTSECVEELKSKKPNTTKLRSFLRTIADTTAFLANGDKLLTSLYHAAEKIGLIIQ
ncbi:MAG TPA: hypothetical protein VF651_10270 [Gammaproteobacteria bacterium]